MFHLLYLVAFAVIAFFAISNLFRSVMTLGKDARQGYGAATRSTSGRSGPSGAAERPSHPELVDEGGQVVREPYLVMKSISVEDAREKLDALYRASPGGSSTGGTMDDDEPGEPVA